ncbi:ribosomal protein L11 methyltransferase [Iodidimonas nitroreducens]|uniref:Ribosomal protein L11 methyltransferase n=1 Tax=Iodidimonas nitroreducens TaxID=1236968 RepID=A0A5A7NAJ7_9PROT|nr:50S ribosomal protein L11 methyltransferase [Iodidimonas nitroreducens]GAK33745.1 ribosomal protein L11 methyltransferase [alpha proteobacterium Q-1]GER03996.1 ribosomal protein L11 methyltransferase [Iodidimonas nitroreducens]
MSGWKLWITAPPHAVAAIEGLFEDALIPFDEDATLSTFEITEDRLWQIEACLQKKPDPDPLEAALNQWAEDEGLGLGPLVLEALEDRDWVSESQKLLAPVIAGRVLVHGSHDRAKRRAFGINLQIEAGQAFGTGQHATTKGCLLMLDQLARRSRRNQAGHPRALLDLGCGSGVLAMAMAQLWRKGVMASDIDPIASRTAAENGAVNHLRQTRHRRAGHGLQVITAPGMKHRSLRRAGPFDLVTANILAGPLISMAAAISAGIAPGGRLILAGLLQSQETAVLAAYRARGFRLEGRLQIADWPSLLLKKSR